MFVDRGCKLAIAQLLVLFRELNEHLGKNRQAGGTLRLSCFFGGWWYDVLRCLGKQKSNGRRGSAGLLKVRLQLVADFLDHPTPASVRMVTATLWNLKVNSWQNLCKAWAVSPDRPASVRTLILTYVITTSLFHIQWWFSLIFHIFSRSWNSSLFGNVRATSACRTCWRSGRPIGTLNAHELWNQWRHWCRNLWKIKQHKSTNRFCWNFSTYSIY